MITNHYGTIKIAVQEQWTCHQVGSYDPIRWCLRITTFHRHRENCTSSSQLLDGLRNSWQLPWLFLQMTKLVELFTYAWLLDDPQPYATISCFSGAIVMAMNWWSVGSATNWRQCKHDPFEMRREYPQALKSSHTKFPMWCRSLPSVTCQSTNVDDKCLYICQLFDGLVALLVMKYQVCPWNYVSFLNSTMWIRTLHPNWLFSMCQCYTHWVG